MSSRFWELDGEGGEGDQMLFRSNAIPNLHQSFLNVNETEILDGNV